jgi:hypothetical protein
MDSSIHGLKHVHALSDGKRQVTDRTNASNMCVITSFGCVDFLFLICANDECMVGCVFVVSLLLFNLFFVYQLITISCVGNINTFSFILIQG